MGSLRVALTVDDTRLVIRNPWRTTVVPWAAKPKFETRDRRQEVNTRAPNAAGPRVEGPLTYRFREIICVADRQRIWIAATSRMRDPDRADQLLAELRDAGSRYWNRSAVDQASDLT